MLIISLLCEHAERASWAYEFVPMTFGKCPFLFILVFPFFALCGLQQAVGLGSRWGMDPSLYPFVPGTEQDWEWGQGLVNHSVTS